MTLRRRRTLPPVSPKTPAELKPLIAAMTEIMEVGEGVRGDPLDTKITWRDILDSGIGKLRDGMRPGDGALINPALPPAPDLATPPAPAGFTAQGSFYGMINLSWQIPGQQYRIHAATNIYRSEVDNFANAEIIAREAGAFYTDYVRDDAIDPDDPTQLKGYYYWITFTSIHDVEGPPNDTAGTYAAPIADIGYVMELITERIDKGVLATELRQEIDSIIPIRDSLLEDMGVIESRIDDEILRLNGIRDGLLADRDETRARIDDEVLRLNNIRDDLLAKSAAVNTRVDAEILRLDGIRDQAFDRLDSVEGTLLGPESVDGTVANRIADERAARIAGLDGERDERVVAIQFEADARADAIQAEAQARGEQIFQVQTQFELEQGYFASQLDVVAAAYLANTATTYSLEEVRVTDSEATATRINGLEVEVEDNRASLIEEQTVRASETSALASQVSVLSAKLDALPTFANGFEAGVEFGRWAVPTGHTLVAESADKFQGDQAALIGSTVASVATGTVPFGVSIGLATGTGDAFAGRRLRIGLAVKAVSGGSAEYAVGYATSDGWFSGWQMQTPQSLWAVQETLIDVPDTPGVDHYIVLWGDTSGGGGTVKIDRLLVEVANTEIPEITAQIETIQQAFVDTEQALTENITNMQSVYDTQIADIQNTQTTLSTDTQALAQDVQTLTATTGDLAADIQFESTVRANETEALAQDVADLWAGVGDAEGRITQEAETRARDGYFRGLMQDVMQASVDTSAATITSIKEVVVEKDAVMARNVEGIEGRVAEAEGAVTDIMQLNIDPGSVLATRFSSIEGSVVDANAKITNIENLDIAEDSVLASRLTEIDGKIGDAEGGIADLQDLNIATDSVLATTLTELRGDVDGASGEISDIKNLTIAPGSVLATTLTELRGDVDDAAGGITNIKTLNIESDSVLATTLTQLEGRVGSAEGDITQAADLIVENDRINGFINDVIAASTDLSSAAYRSITDVVLEKDRVVSSRLVELTGEVEDANGRITNLENLDISSDSVLLSKLTTLEGSIGNAQGAINDLDTVLVTGDNAVVTRLSEAEAAVQDAAGAIQDIVNLEVGASSVLAERFSTIDGEVGNAQGAINDIISLNLAPDSAVLTRFSELDAGVGDANGRITGIENLTLDETSALLSKLNTLEADVGNASGEITNIKTLNLTEDDALLTELNRLSGSLGDAEADIKNITNIELSDGSTIAQQFNTIDASLGDLSTSYQNIVELTIDSTTALGQRLEALGTAEEFVYDLANVNITGDQPPLLQRLIGVETQTGQVEIRIGTVEDTVGTLFTAKVEENGLIGGFGLFNDGEIVDAGFDVDRFWVGRTDTNTTGYRVKPFIIDNGTVYIDNAMIRDASIQEGQLGPISIGKFFFENPITGIKEPVTTVGGLIRADSIDVDNLSVAEAARFYGNVQSGNYIPGEAGWLINQAGDVEFNEGIFNGTVEFNNVTGAGGLAGKDTVDYNTDIDNLPEINIKRLERDAYSASVQPSGYAVSDRVGQLIFQVTTGAGWPVWGGCVTYWYNTSRVTQVVYGSGDGDEWTRQAYGTGSWSEWKRKEIFSSGDVEILQTTGAGSLAGKNSVDIADANEVLNAGVLARKDKVDYEADVENRPVVRLGTDAYAQNNRGDEYTPADKASELIFTTTSDNWPGYGGVITYWHSSTRATQIWYSQTGDGEEKIRRLTSDSYPNWTSWRTKEVFSSSDVDVLNAINAPAAAGADVTGDNTALDTVLVAGMEAVTVRAATENGIVDPGFNRTVQGDSFWETSGSAVIADRTTYGPSVYFDSSNDNVSEITARYSDGSLQRITVKPGQTVGVSFTGRVSNRNVGGYYAYFGAAVFFSDSNGSYISAQSVRFNYDDDNLINAWDNQDGPIRRFEIADYVGSVTAPDNAASCYVRFRVRNMQFHLLRFDVDAASVSRGWIRPNSTLIDGNKIYTGDAYVDTLQIQGNAITVPNEDTGTLVDGTGGWKLSTAVVTVTLNEASPILVWWSFAQGYFGGSGEWGFAIRHNGDEVALREGMDARADYPSGVIEVSGVSGDNVFRLDWIGSAGDLEAIGSLVIMGAQR